MITIIDTGISNLGSLLHAFQLIGAEVRTTRSPSCLDDTTALILPGVGAFGTGMARLREYGLVDGIRRHACELGRPTIGICLGMQLLSNNSDEHGDHAGLGIIPGATVRLDPNGGADHIPRLGWAEVRAEPGSDLISLLPVPRDFYFAHSYHVVCDDPRSVVASTPFGAGSVAAIIARNNIMGCQFHPEKSQDAGMNFLSNMIARISQGTRTFGEVD
jgi:glutamine amidotransferase